MITCALRVVFGVMVVGMLASVWPAAARSTQGATTASTDFPKLVHRVPATLPRNAVPGHVVLMFVVTPSGEVSFVKTLAGADGLKSAAETALSRWQFSLGRRAVTGLVSLGVGRPDAFAPRPLAPVQESRPTIARGETGVVVVEVGVAPDGHIEAVRAVSGAPELRSAAETALKAWRYPPAALPFKLTVSVRVDALGRAH